MRSAGTPLAISPSRTARARRALDATGYDAVHVATRDGQLGDPDHAPYDAIVLTGSTPILPPSLQQQLAQGGRLFAVVGERPVMSARLVTCTAPGAFHAVDLFETVIDRLVNAARRPRFRF